MNACLNVSDLLKDKKLVKDFLKLWSKISIKSIIENIENRTNILMNNIKTDMGKKISKDKYKIIKMFIEDYHNTMFYQ